MANISTLGSCNVSLLPLKNHQKFTTHFFLTNSSNLLGLYHARTVNLRKGVLKICQSSINKNNSFIATSSQYPCKEGLNLQSNIMCYCIPAPNSNPVCQKLLRTKAACSDKAFLRVRESEIVEEEAEDVPADFPLKIKDNYRKRNVKLSRQYEGETIEVKVGMIGDDDEYDNQCHFDVKIFKHVEPYLEFSCGVEPDAEYIYINSLQIKNRGTSKDATYGYLDFERVR